MQIGEFALEQHMQMAVPRDVAGAAGSGAERAQRLVHRGEHGRMLAHAEIIVRAPDRHLGADPVIEGAGKTTTAPLEIGEDSVAPLAAKRVEAGAKKGFVIHYRHNRG